MDIVQELLKERRQAQAAKAQRRTAARSERAAAISEALRPLMERRAYTWNLRDRNADEAWESIGRLHPAAAAVDLVRRVLSEYRIDATPTYNFIGMHRAGSDGLEKASIANSPHGITDGVITVEVGLKGGALARTAYLDVPIMVRDGLMLRPGVGYVEGQPEVLTQSLFDDLMQRTSKDRRIPPDRGMFTPPGGHRTLDRMRLFSALAEDGSRAVRAGGAFVPHGDEDYSEPEWWIDESDEESWYVFDKNDAIHPDDAVDEVAEKHFGKVKVEDGVTLVSEPITDEGEAAVEEAKANGQGFGPSAYPGRSDGTPTRWSCGHGREPGASSCPVCDAIYGRQVTSGQRAAQALAARWDSLRTNQRIKLLEGMGQVYANRYVQMAYHQLPPAIRQQVDQALRGAAPTSPAPGTHGLSLSDRLRGPGRAASGPGRGVECTQCATTHDAAAPCVHCDDGTHAADNQGLCHNCGALVNEEWAEAYEEHDRQAARGDDVAEEGASPWGPSHDPDVAEEGVRGVEHLDLAERARDAVAFDPGARVALSEDVEAMEVGSPALWTLPAGEQGTVIRDVDGDGRRFLVAFDAIGEIVVPEASLRGA